MSSQYDKLESAAQGRLGGLYVADTNQHDGEFCKIMALTQCTFTTLTGNISGGASITLPAGRDLPGYFTTVKLAGGTAVLYYAA